jgi:hypothetical protein
MVDKKQTINPAALWWRDCRADLSASLAASLSVFPPLCANPFYPAIQAVRSSVSTCVHLWLNTWLRPKAALCLSASVVKSLSALRTPHSALGNPLIIKPDPAQSCLIKPNTAANDF